MSSPANRAQSVKPSLLLNTLSPSFWPNPQPDPIEQPPQAALPAGSAVDSRDIALAAHCTAQRPERREHRA